MQIKLPSRAGAARDGVAPAEWAHNKPFRASLDRVEIRDVPSMKRAPRERYARRVRLVVRSNDSASTCLRDEQRPPAPGEDRRGVARSSADWSSVSQPESRHTLL